MSFPHIFPRFVWAFECAVWIIGKHIIISFSAIIRNVLGFKFIIHHMYVFELCKDPNIVS